ncbi:flagellar basal body-associated FliL family protein [Paracoccus sp. DMF-8]|uniref:flagellar basal body-associated FliL family protein n=1 Tax=Paracoccus sp. DMF-8 TaxID=3019445 RepID=UPI0023E3BFC7|nr:flagellar basal body-associated FliL family protein [Paracoccus sp. DMF-8]MDF3607261.1 flagellar basal body-associated FliL family protein [Paracoccus sp. DMF-8]
MSEIAEPDKKPAGMTPRAKILAAALILMVGGAGFASTYLGVIDPDEIFKPTADDVASEGPDFVFVDVPQVVLALPGARPRTLVLSAKIEADADQVQDIEYLLPRVSDSFNLFLSDIDPAAFERRGILDIIRSELATRLSYILGPDLFRDLLITEFRIQ